MTKFETMTIGELRKAAVKRQINISNGRKKKGNTVSFKPRSVLLKELKNRSVSFGNNFIGTATPSESSAKIRNARSLPPCNEKKLFVSCLSKNKNNNACANLFPCIHKKGFTTFENTANYKNYMKSLKNRRLNAQGYGIKIRENKRYMIFKNKDKFGLVSFLNPKKSELFLLENGNTIQVIKNKLRVVKP